MSAVSAYTFLSPVASSILAPSLEHIGRDLNIHNDSEKSLCLSIFVLGFAFGPLVLAPVSEIYGRNITLQGSQIMFFIFNCACGFAMTKEQLLAFRFLGGVGGSAPLALGPGVLADLFSADERGLSIGIYTLLPILGPAIGPICGGFITQYSTWRWGFWGTAIVNVPILVLGMAFLEETYAPVLLRRRKQKLFLETGNQALFTRYDQSDRTFTSELSQAMMRPMKLMATQIIIVVMGLYQAYLYGLMYIVLTTFPRLWAEDYHQSPGIAGLNYLSLGLGYSVGIQVSIPMLFDDYPTPLLLHHADCALYHSSLHTAKTSCIVSSRSAITALGVLNSDSLSLFHRLSYCPWVSSYTAGLQSITHIGSSPT